ncbi:MAG: hypothetical protein HY246_00900, partial [Proteobacteria bacterium]|nr:hypothetical protein [Pseudomonadota bacterium]
MHGLVGYCDRWSVKPGADIRFMVSSEFDRAFDCRFVRLVCADPNPDGPGYKEIEMPSPAGGRKTGRFQPAFPGSYGVVPALDLGDLSRGLTLTATVWPTTPAKGRQGIISLAAGGWRATLTVEAGGGGAVEIIQPNGARSVAAVAAPMLAREWYDLVAMIDPVAGRIAVCQTPRRHYGTIRDEGRTEATLIDWQAPAGPVRVRFAALAPDSSEVPADGHFNGKLERPCLWRGAHAHDASLAVQRGPIPDARTPDLIAAWDFSIGIPST